MDSEHVQAGNVRLQYYCHGNGPETVLLVHGYTMSARLWQLTMEKMDPTAYRVLALNNRGAGDSARTPSEDDYSVENFASDLANAIDSLGLNGFTLVGHSMGGATVTQYALNDQSRLKKLVLLNPAPLNGRSPAPNWEETIRAQFADGSFARGDTSVSGPHVPTAFAEAVMGDVARNPVERAIGGRRSMSQLKLRGRLNEIRVPCMVVGGDLDTTVGVDQILAEYLALPRRLPLPPHVPRHRPLAQRRPPGRTCIGAGPVHPSIVAH